MTHGSTTTTVDPAALQHFEAKLRFETDPSDVDATLRAGERFVLVDTRGAAAWSQGRIAGAVHLQTAQIPERATAVLEPGLPVVVYCWGPGCNGSTKAALALARLGYSVREMIGGFEYWAREGLAIQTATGRTRRPIDDLTAPLSPSAPRRTGFPG
jgi:rhodanese-related sulfurtransferase